MANSHDQNVSTAWEWHAKMDDAQEACKQWHATVFDCDIQLRPVQRQMATTSTKMNKHDRVATVARAPERNGLVLHSLHEAVDSV